jgi:uncharacterized protein YbaP (TraB family)
MVRTPWNRARAGFLLGAALALAFAVPASAEPALWKVQGPHATVYLFGTVHALKKTTVWRSPKVEAAFAASGSLWEEVANADDVAAAQPLIVQYGLDPAHPLSSTLDDSAKAKLSAFETAYGLPAAAVEPFRPWLAALTFSVLPMMRAGYDPKSGVDLVLKTEALAHGKSVNGFETLEQQMHFMADLPLKQQVDYMLFTLDNADSGPAQLGQMVDVWAAGDTAKLEAMLNDELFKKYPNLYDVLLVQRNRAIAAKIEDLLKGDGVVFVAVGAGHLTGPDSIQADLAKDGIQAVRQ